MLLFALALMPSSTHAQVTQPGTPKEIESKTASLNIEAYLDRLIDSAVVAGDAAGVVKEADRFRTEASQRLKTGHRDEARALFRQAGELIAAAAPDGDIKRQDPLLREYLRDITKQLIALETVSPTSSAELVGENFAGGSYAAQPRVTAFLDYFQGRGRARLEIGRARFASYRPMMARIFREEAWTDERGNPEKSTRAAARYLRDLHALFGDWLLALTAYNWGEGHVAKVIHRTGIRDFWTMADRGLLPQETANYVPSVLAASRLLFGNGNLISNEQDKEITRLATESH